MSDADELAEEIARRAASTDRFIVGIGGPPAAGKSTFAEAIAARLPSGSAFVFGMDGFHYDDAVLARMGLSARKGAPETFDFHGFEATLPRLREGGRDVAIPVFDRSLELSRAAAEIVPASARFVICEGNYLLLDEAPWSELEPLFDFTIFLDIEREELVQRLVSRWMHYGREQEAARNWIETNDMRNADRVWSRRRPAQVIRVSRIATSR